jgi:hypothetical protein
MVYTEDENDVVVGLNTMLFPAASVRFINGIGLLAVNAVMIAFNCVIHGDTSVPLISSIFT